MCRLPPTRGYRSNKCSATQAGRQQAGRQAEGKTGKAAIDEARLRGRGGGVAATRGWSQHGSNTRDCWAALRHRYVRLEPQLMSFQTTGAILEEREACIVNFGGREVALGRAPRDEGTYMASRAHAPGVPSCWHGPGNIGDRRATQASGTPACVLTV